VKASCDSDASTTRRGGFAVISNLLNLAGTRAPSRRRTTFAFGAFAIAAFLAINASSAFAAAPETPEAIAPPYLTSTEASLGGYIDPGQSGGGLETLGYEFLYKESSTECSGGSTTAEQTSSGEGHQEVGGFVTGLTPATKYTFCLLVRNGGAETSVSAPFTFKTRIAPEAPETKPATAVTETTAKLHGVLNPHAPGEPGTYEFRYAPGVECEGEGGTSTETELASGAEAEAVESTATGLLPTDEYTFCLLARNEAGETTLGPPQSFTVPAQSPSVTEVALKSSDSSSVTFSAKVDAGGLSTSFHVDYGPTATYGSSTPEQSIGSPASPVSVTALLAGLTPGVEYHYCFVTTNSLGQSPCTDSTFTLSSSGASALPCPSLYPNQPLRSSLSIALPDCRGYELVSPADSPGDVYIPAVTAKGRSEDTIAIQPFLAAAEGDSVAWVGDPGQTGGDGAIGVGEGNQYVSARAAAGWTSTNLTPRYSQETANDALETNYEAFTSDLSVGIFRSPSPALAAAAQPPAPTSGCNLYSRIPSESAFHPLTSSVILGNCSEFGPSQRVFAGASADGHQLLFETSAALTEGAEEAPSPLAHNLYESVGGNLTQINVLPGGEQAPESVFGSPPGTRGANRADVISADGTKTFWTDRVEPETVYEHLAGTGTIQVSAGTEPATFRAATPNGRYVFYTEGEKLWRFDTSTSSREAFVGEGLAAENPGVQGILGVSTDGTKAYVVAEGELSTAPNARGEVAEPRTCEIPEEQAEREEEVHGRLSAGIGCNLYLVEAGSPPVYIAALSATDDRFGNAYLGNATVGDWNRGTQGASSAVSQDGSAAVFESILQLTGYNNSELLVRGGVESAKEIFSFDSASGVLSCVSCDQNGAPPANEAGGGNPGQNGTKHEGGGTGLPISSQRTSQRRWLSADGDRVFFETSQPLVPTDANGVQDVYEWEREGAPSCPIVSPHRREHGCDFLISGGDNSDYSFFIDASADGNDVFFTTRGQLVPQDQNDKTSLYDARVGGGFAELTSSACSEPACIESPESAQAFRPPSSESLSGPGNLHPRKHRKHKRKHRHHRRHRADHHRFHRRATKRIPGTNGKDAR
jgi:hypothetical protein